MWGTDLMEAANDTGTVFAGTADGGCIWPDFLPAYDAAVTLVKLLDLLAAVDRPLSAVVAGAARRPTSSHETIVTPWERKGTVMREMVERVGSRNVELVDGVKVIDDRRLGAGAARPRGGRHPRVGRGRDRHRLPPPRRGVRPAHPRPRPLTHRPSSHLLVC